MHRLMDASCSNCNKFSHCNNNDLICISKYKEKEQELQEVKEELNECRFDRNLAQLKCHQLEQKLDNIKDVSNTYQMDYIFNNGVNLLTTKILKIIEGEK